MNAAQRLPFMSLYLFPKFAGDISGRPLYSEFFDESSEENS
jgi:hypothetical protein